MMTKDEALKMVIEFLEYHVEHSEIWGYDAEGTIEACKEALEQPSVAELNDEYLRDTHVEGLSQPAQEPTAWISIFDKLPEPDTEVLTWGSGTASNNYGCMQAWFTRNGWQELDSCGDFCNDISPTHWMPLPDAPKEL